MSYKYKVTVEAVLTSKTEIEPKALKAAAKQLAHAFPQNVTGDSELDDHVGCGKATVTIE